VNAVFAHIPEEVKAFSDKDMSMADRINKKK
jgi:hypothetical protein